MSSQFEGCMFSQFEGLVLAVLKPALAFWRAVDYSPVKRRSRTPSPGPPATTSRASGRSPICRLGPGAPSCLAAHHCVAVPQRRAPFLICNDEGVSDAVPYVHVTNFDPELRALAVVFSHGLAEYPKVERPAAG